MPQGWTSCPTQDHYTYAVTSELCHSLSLSLPLCRQTAGLSQSASMALGRGLVHHGTWYQVRDSFIVTELSLPPPKTHYHNYLVISAGTATKLLPAWLDSCFLPTFRTRYLLIFFLKVFWEKHKHSPCSPVLGVGLWSIQLRRSTALTR